MPPAVAAIVATVGSVIIGALKVSLIVKALLTIALTVATTLLAKKPNANKLNQGQELRTKFDPTMTRQILVGLVATGGSCHFTHTTTDNYKKPNRYLYRVIQLSDRPIDALVRVMEGANELTWSGDLTTGWRTCTQHRDKDNNPKMWMRVYLGSDSPTADSTLISETGGLWTSAHKGTGIAYAIVKMDYDDEAFSGGEPELTWVVRGAHCYDDRKDSTKPGGSGAHRLDNYSTWEYSENASVITAQLLRGFYTNGKLIIGVQAEERDLSTSMLFSAYNTCDQLVLDSTGYEPRYVAGMILSANETVDNMLVDFQAAMDGRIFDRGGAITILPGANRTPVVDLTDDDIDWTKEKSWQPKASLEQMLNHITSNFVDAATNFQERNLPVMSNPAWELDDGGERFSEFFSFRAVNKWSQGQRITKRMHLASRWSGTCAIVCPIWLLEAEQGDWITLTSERWDFDTKYFEIQDHIITAEASVALVLREVDPDIDVWDHSIDEKPRDDTTWNEPDYTLPEPLIYATAFKGTDPLASGVETFNIKMGLVDDPALYGAIVKYIEYQYADDAETNVVSVGIIPIIAPTYVATGLVPSTDYKVRARLRDNARAGDWTDWISVATDIAEAVAAGYGPFLTNQTVAIAVGSDGTIPGGALADAGGQFVVTRGGAILTTPDVVWSVLSELGVDVSISSTTGVYTVSSMSADKGTAIFRAVVDGLNIDLQYNISKVYGADPLYSVALTNENHTLQADAEGVVSSFLGADGYVVVSDGVSDIVGTGTVSLGAVTVSGVTGTVNTANNIPVSGYPKGYYQITAMSADTGYMDIPVTVNGILYTMRMSVSKSRQGSALRLWASRTAITYDTAGTASPSTQDTNLTTTLLGATGGTYTWEVASITGAFGAPGGNLTLDGSGAFGTMSRTQFEAIAGATLGARIKVSRTVGGVTLEDSITITKALQGASAKSLKTWADRSQIRYDNSGSPSPTTQTTNFIAEKINTTATVTWTVFDLNNVAKTPTSTYLSSATGDTVSMTRAQFESASGASGGVIVKGTLTDGVTLTDAVQIIKTQNGANGADGTDGDPAIGFVQDTPVPTSTFVNQTWYRPTTKEWYRAGTAGCSTMGGSCWIRILGNLSAKDLIATADVSSGAVNWGDWQRQGGTIGYTNETQLITTGVNSNVAGSSRTLLRMAFSWYLYKTNPTQGSIYSFTIRGWVKPVGVGSRIYSTDTWTANEVWATANETGDRQWGTRINMIEFVFEGLAGNNYEYGFEITIPSGHTVVLTPYRYMRLDNLRAMT